MAEKTEKATPKKLRDARKKGQVAKSQDFPAAFTFVVSIMGVVLSTGYLYKNLGAYIINTFKAIRTTIDLEHRGGAFFVEAVQVIAVTSFPIIVLVAISGVIVNFLIIGPVFSFEAMKFDLKKLNPVEGIKQKFKLKILVELLKSIFKIIGAAVIIFYAIWHTLPEVIQTAGIPVIGSAILLKAFLKKIAIQVGVFFLLVAIFDLAFQKKNFAKEMMMEKFEIKQEFKDTEGDPLIKGKRKERFREIAYSEGPSAARRARAIITNPTHIAVAIGIEKGDNVPTIITMGQGKIAEKIIEIANEAKIPIMRNVPLARQLFQRGRISDYIPEDTYKAVAEVIKWISQMEKAEEEVNLEIFR
jgi:type III secretion protein U